MIRLIPIICSLKLRKRRHNHHDRVNKCLVEVFFLLLIMEPIEVSGENAEATIWYERS